MSSLSGLEGVIAVTTAIGRVDGERGELVVRGRRMDDVAPELSFGEAVSWFWDSELDQAIEPAELGEARERAFVGLAEGGAFRSAAGSMDFLRHALALCAVSNDPREDALTAAAMLAVATPAWWRSRQGEDPVPPDPSADHAADVLRMLHGRPASSAAMRALSTYLIAVTDHGMNASTFTARVIASTRSDVISAVSGALGALKGPLHGGAPGPVLDMLDEIGAPDAAEAWIRASLARGERIMGMGHRVYRVRDPRAEIFERAITQLAAGTPSPRLELARAVEQAAERVLLEHRPDRVLKANVEFYTAVLLEAVGIPRELFTPTFAIGRVLGWCAHILEQQRTGRLIRPRSAYSGPEPT